MERIVVTLLFYKILPPQRDRDEPRYRDGSEMDALSYINVFLSRSVDDRLRRANP